MTSPDGCRDRGSVMPMTTVLVAFLMISAWSLISASQQWGARRDAYAAAAAAARAAAQADPASLRYGVIVDEVMATDRAQAVLAAAGYEGSVVVDGETVTVTVSAAVEYPVVPVDHCAVARRLRPAKAGSVGDDPGSRIRMRGARHLWRLGRDTQRHGRRRSFR